MFSLDTAIIMETTVFAVKPNITVCKSKLAVENF